MLTNTYNALAHVNYTPTPLLKFYKKGW